MRALSGHWYVQKSCYTSCTCYIAVVHVKAMFCRCFMFASFEQAVYEALYKNHLASFNICQRCRLSILLFAVSDIHITSSRYLCVLYICSCCVAKYTVSLTLQYRMTQTCLVYCTVCNTLVLLQYGFSTKMLALLSKPQLLEQAGKTTVEQCLTVVVLSLAMVCILTYNLLLLRQSNSVSPS